MPEEAARGPASNGDDREPASLFVGHKGSPGDEAFYSLEAQNGVKMGLTWVKMGLKWACKSCFISTVKLPNFSHFRTKKRVNYMVKRHKWPPTCKSLHSPSTSLSPPPSLPHTISVGRLVRPTAAL